jgi:hypothetical protein
VAGRDEIWAYGLRNPWRFSFDRLSGDMVIGDVGQDTHEEVDFAPSAGTGLVSGGGADYGWNCREGFSAYSGSCGSSGPFTEPVFDYPHEDPGGGAAHGCSIIGGYVVRDMSVADLYGRYLYTDFCTGEVRSLLLPSSATGLATDDRATGLSVANPTSFGEDSCGRIYVASNDGPVYRIEGPTPSVCPVAVPISGPRVSGHKHRRGYLSLRVRDAGRQVKLLVRLSPCAGQGGMMVQLKRGGRRFRRDRLSHGCRTHFYAQLSLPATFRALLRGTPTLRSHRLTVDARRFLR